MLVQIDSQSSVMDWGLADGAVVGSESGWVGVLARSRALSSFVVEIGGMGSVGFIRVAHWLPIYVFCNWLVRGT